MSTQKIKADVLQKYANSKCDACLGRGVTVRIKYLYANEERTEIKKIKLCRCVEKSLEKLKAINYEQFLLKETYGNDDEQ